MLTVLKRLVKEEQGQGMAEYGLILALVAVVVAVALIVFGKTIKEKFDAVTTEMGGTPTPEGES